MKTLALYITEALHVNKDTKENYHKYCPKNYDELNKLINKLIIERGKEADLNDIDVSDITNMSWLFCDSIFNGDISGWDVSNVTNMNGMFYGSNFNGDISKWNTSKVTSMTAMFKSSKFSGDISGWDVNNVINMISVFEDCPLEKNPPKWYKK